MNIELFSLPRIVPVWVQILILGTRDGGHMQRGLSTINAVTSVTMLWPSYLRSICFCHYSATINNLILDVFYDSLVYSQRLDTNFIIKTIQALENPQLRPRVLVVDTEFGYYRKSRSIWEPFVKEISLVDADHNVRLSVKTTANTF